jgi:hypothetical protein
VFDVHLQDVFYTLLSGVCVCIASEAQLMNELERALASTGADLVQLTPTVAGLVEPESVPELKTLHVVLTGELATSERIALWMGHVKLMNAYGPAEAGLNTLLNRSIAHGTSRRDPTLVEALLPGFGLWIRATLLPSSGGVAVELATNRDDDDNNKYILAAFIVTTRERAVVAKGIEDEEIIYLPVSDSICTAL